MSDTRNHTTRDQLAAVIAARRIRGCDHNEGISACARCTADALLASDAIAAVRAAAVAETTAAIEATLDRLAVTLGGIVATKYQTEIRAALSGGRTALDTTLAQARADALREYANLATERANHLAPPRFKSTADGRERNVWNLVAHELNNRADTGADQ